ncbi:hypothetical protein WISP_111426 [Willisornis vidua]|uniref:EGF-like domain-containing protein n=1 Tax=Willisornis vidua TaxID=1566151 RepID=A0ABQ9D0W1_9PASS|nr:hypothetical protein WISP_111426 [Willisornis vidua]
MGHSRLNVKRRGSAQKVDATVKQHLQGQKIKYRDTGSSDCSVQDCLNCEFRPCEASNPCENGAMCIEELNLDVFPLGFHCQCVKGFAGPRCEINVNECSSNPCLHGYCYDIVDGFYCLCNPGYAGLKCDQDIDDCIVNACEHNSTCVDLHLYMRKEIVLLSDKSWW